MPTEEVEEVWGKFFKAEVRTSGAKLFAQEKVSLPSGSDTAIQAYVRVAPPSRVKFSATDIGSESFIADCTCPVAKKSQFCKHVWATLLCVERKYPDFLSAKRRIEKPASPEGSAFAAADVSNRGGSTGATDAEERRPDPRASYRESAKSRAAEYRKEQYQKQKLRAKARKQSASELTLPKGRRLYPEEVEKALGYFSVNGFPMTEGPSEEILGEAKKKLSRVFHPDKGGTNGEIVELNRNCEVLQRFLKG